MNSFQQIEVIGIILIIGFQLYIFSRTKLKIGVFKGIFPEVDKFQILKPVINKSYFKLHPKDILNNLKKYIEESNRLDNDSSVDSKVEIDLIGLTVEGNDITNKITYSLNTYLLRNRGVASDFHLIKDVVERNCDSIEEDINQTISLPLYLGLLGTFLGIVIGLFQISGIDFSADPSALDRAISLLLGGVKIAMIASFTGLLLTIINSGYFFKGAKAQVEDKKNDFYTFIQIDLLPLLNQNINSTLYSLQNNLHKFNEEFKDNVSKLSNVMGKNYEALIAQEKILTTLDNMDITEFAKANVKILKELQISTQKFSEFNHYLQSVNEMVDSSRLFTAKVKDMIKRTDNFHELGEKVLSTFDNNLQLQKFLQDHYSSLDESRQLIATSVGKVGNVVDESLEQLKIFTQERINEIQKISLRELDLLQNQYPEKWKKLDNLVYLEPLNKSLNEIKIGSASQIGSIGIQITTLNEKVELLNEIIEGEVNKESIVSRTFGWIKKLKH